MAKYRDNLPQLSKDLFLTDGGLETILIFQEGFDLPEFAAFDLLKHERGVESLKKYYRNYSACAREHEVGFVLESATYRASSDWGQKIGYSMEQLDRFNHQAIEMLAKIREEFETDRTKMVISGCVGPRGDGYNPEQMLSAEQAEEYHSAQIRTLSRTEADLVSAFTLSYTAEAIGIARAAVSSDIPVVIGFTVETDGRLPAGKSLQRAIEEVDEATSNAPAYYMINCAHPSHFENELSGDEAWLNRLRAIRANASSKSHAELNEATELDAGNPVEFGQIYRRLRQKLQHVNILGGCCGTDHRHVKEIAQACLA